MPSNSLLHFISNIVNFAGFKAKDYHFITDTELVIKLEKIEKLATCPHCDRTTDKVHQSHWYRVRDIPFSGWDVFLSVNRRQFKCLSCQRVFSEELHFVKMKRTYTKRLAEKVIAEVLETDVVNTGRRNRMSPAEIETLLKEVEDEYLVKKPDSLKRLGIDEISHVKGGKNYVAVLVDLDSRKPLMLLKKRNQETLLQYLQGLGSELLEQIEEVSIDLWTPYKSVVEKLMPNAQVVADRFHVMKQINMELDNARKKEKRAAQTIKNGQEKARILSGITHSKYPLLKNKIDLDDREKEKLEELDLVAPKLTKMHQIKEDFRNIFEQHITADEAFWLLIEWTENAYTFFPNSCQTIKRWIDEITAYFDRRTTQGVVEGINQKIKLIKRRAYGIPIFENFRRRILLNWHFCC